MKSSSKYGIVLGVIVVAVVLVFALTSNANNSGNPLQTGTNKTGNSSLSDLATVKVPNGVHEAQKQYAFHAGVNTVDISVGTQNDVIENISVNAVGNVDPMSARIIENFASALPDLVVGKKIEDVNLPRNVAGSSLTTATVNDYLHSLYE